MEGGNTDTGAGVDGSVDDGSTDVTVFNGVRYINDIFSPALANRTFDMVVSDFGLLNYHHISVSGAEWNNTVRTPPATQ